MSAQGAELAHMLTDKEKELRDWLRDQPGGSEKWMVIKAGFRRSYLDGKADALTVAAEHLDEVARTPRMWMAYPEAAQIVRNLAGGAA